jgi:hypothetical protein
VLLGLMCGFLLSCSSLLAQAPSATSPAATSQTQPSSAPAPAQPQASTALGTISGTVLDANGTPLPGVQVKLGAPAATVPSAVVTGQNGQYSFSNLAPGSYQLSIAHAGFKTKTMSASLPAGQDYDAPAVTLELAPVVTEVDVRLTTEEIAEEQIKQQEKQKLLAVIPNFYTSYVANPAPMNTKQKFELAWKAVIDPSSFVIAGIIAGGQQANNSVPGYGQGAAGYANRFGAAYGDFVVGTYISNAILPSIFKQDPRYFYKGTGTTKSRIAWALKRSVMARGDNGHWEPDYSGILGSLAAGGISNLYYPEGSRHGFETTLTNTLIGIATGAGVNILQEFVFPKITPKLPKHDPSTS